jgi:hypothetical protein
VGTAFDNSIVVLVTDANIPTIPVSGVTVTFASAGMSFASNGDCSDRRQRKHQHHGDFYRHRGTSCGNGNSDVSFRCCQLCEDSYSCGTDGSSSAHSNHHYLRTDLGFLNSDGRRGDCYRQLYLFHSEHRARNWYCAQSMTFTPTDTVKYATVVGTASFTVNKATPAVTAWSTASAIAYGQTLASSNLTGGIASVASSFAFSTPATVPVIGTTAQNITFTSTDTSYTTVLGTASVTALLPEFSMVSSGSTTQTVVPGGAVTYQFAMAPTYGSYEAEVNFSVSGLPPGPLPPSRLRRSLPIANRKR